MDGELLAALGGPLEMSFRNAGVDYCVVLPTQGWCGFGEGDVINVRIVVWC